MNDLKSVARYDKGEIKLDAKITEHGYIKATAIVTRTGVFNYRNPDGTIRRELRHPEDVLKADSLESIKLLPITLGHPQERLVNASNVKRLAIGYTGEKIDVAEPHIISNLVITDAEGVEAVKNGKAKELSLGYTVDLIEENGKYDGQEYDFRQSNIVYNHLSLVDKARAGKEARIMLDRFDAEEVFENEIVEEVKKNIEEVKPMSKLKKIKIDDGEYEVATEVSSEYEMLKSENERLKADLLSRDEDIRNLRDEVERLKAERDQLKEKDSSMMDKKTDSEDKFLKAVKERVKLVSTAKQVLDSEMFEKLDDMTDLDIKKSVVKARCPNANLDKASDIYVQARYDALIEELPVQKETTNKIIQKLGNTDSVNYSADDARLKMIESHKNGYKKNNKEAK
jgi:uncharacterized protein